MELSSWYFRLDKSSTLVVLFVVDVETSSMVGRFRLLKANEDAADDFDTDDDEGTEDIQVVACPDDSPSTHHNTAWV